MDPVMIQTIIEAIQANAWTPPTIGLMITLVIAIWRYYKPQVWDKIPSKYKPIPALILAVLTAFGTAVSSGATWTVALSIAIYTFIVSWPISIGVADAFKRFTTTKEVKEE